MGSSRGGCFEVGTYRHPLIPISYEPTELHHSYLWASISEDQTKLEDCLVATTNVTALMDRYKAESGEQVSLNVAELFLYLLAGIQFTS